jgi:guanine nucleotide-binding protein G(o) subunit alpha
MKFVWQKRSLVNIVDSHKAFLDDIDRIVSPTFKPTLQDVLLARKRTTNVTVQRYRIGPTDYELYDVGGQRQERRKWFQCFDRVDGVIFVGALSEYDQHLSESKKQNRLVETLELFRSVCMNRAFINTPVILFLNKIDILAEKIQYSDIAAQKPFTDYKGPKNNFSYAVQYFIEKFKECLVEGEYNTNFIQPCTATDTDNSK